MRGRTSRTYKLQLSDEGVDHFIDCHARLARVVRELIPYGITLYTAMAIFARLDCNEQIAELESFSCKRLAGRVVHYVGFSIGLRMLITRITADIAGSNRIAAAPPVSRLYVAGLSAFSSAEDQELRSAYLAAKEVLASRARTPNVVQ